MCNRQIQHAFVGLFALSLLGAAAARTSVLEVARSYEDGGGYDDKWHGTGVPDEIRFKDERILAKGKGTYCCGFTFAVAMQVATDRGLLRDKTVDQIRKFQKQWYGATDESAETQCVLAVTTLGIGTEIKPEHAQPGDFLQLWRATKSGHSVIFLDWVMRDGRPIGLTYRSSQGSTKGISDHTEYFADIDGVKGSVLPDRLHFCRLDEGKRR